MGHDVIRASVKEAQVTREHRLPTQDRPYYQSRPIRLEGTPWAPEPGRKAEVDFSWTARVAAFLRRLFS